MKVKFGDIARESRRVFSGDKSGVPVVGLEHLIPGEVRFSAYNQDTDNTFTKAFKKGHVLFGRRRAYLKKAALAEIDGICSGDITVIEAIPGKLHPRLLPFLIQNDRFFGHSVSGSAGSLSPRVKWAHLADFSFDLPPLAEQERVADLLWSAYELKERYRETIAATDTLVRAQFRQMFGCSNLSGGTLKDLLVQEVEQAKKKYSGDTVIRYIDISSVDSHSQKIINTNEYLLKEAPSRAQQCVRNGDILYSLVRPNLKTMAIVDGMEPNLVASTGFCVLRPQNSDSIGFLMGVLTSGSFTAKMTRVAKGSNYPAVNNGDVLHFPVPIPPVPAQREFSHFRCQAENTKRKLESGFARIDAVMKAMVEETLG
jgi:type I restriction enzyme S subunit